MNKKVKIGLLAMFGSALLLGSVSLQASDDPWVVKGNSWTWNKEIMGDKAGDQWDFQKTDQVSNPGKWVLHKSDGNPVIWLRIDDTVSSWSNADIAADLRTRFKARGITVDTGAVQKMSINNNDVYIVSGVDSAKGVRYNTAVFPKTGYKRAYQLELVAPTNEFSTYEPAFKGMIQTVKLIP